MKLTLRVQVLVEAESCSWPGALWSRFCVPSRVYHSCITVHSNQGAHCYRNITLLHTVLLFR